MDFKDGVDLDLSRAMVTALPLIEKAHKDAGIKRGAFITSAKDGKHMKGSKHHWEPDNDKPSDAVDLRTKDLTKQETEELSEALATRLNGPKQRKPYDVVVEVDHIHVEYDPT